MGDVMCVPLALCLCDTITMDPDNNTGVLVGVSFVYAYVFLFETSYFPMLSRHPSTLKQWKTPSKVEKFQNGPLLY